MTGDPTKIPLKVNPLERRMRGTTVHGHITFEVPFISEITAGLWQGGCQDGLVLPAFISHLVSLYPWEKYEVPFHLLTSLTVRMYDSLEQEFDHVESLARWVNDCRRQGGAVLVHCQAGLNRSSLVVARALMLSGMSAEEAIRTIRDRRSPAALCNPAFEKHLREIKQ